MDIADLMRSASSLFSVESFTREFSESSDDMLFNASAFKWAMALSKRNTLIWANCANEFIDLLCGGIVFGRLQRQTGAIEFEIISQFHGDAVWIVFGGAMAF